MICQCIIHAHYVQEHITGANQTALVWLFQIQDVVILSQLLVNVHLLCTLTAHHAQLTTIGALVTTLAYITLINHVQIQFPTKLIAHNYQVITLIAHHVLPNTFGAKLQRSAKLPLLVVLLLSLTIIIAQLI